jgi:hypothetical protein
MLAVLGSLARDQPRLQPQDAIESVAVVGWINFEFQPAGLIERHVNLQRRLAAP